MQETKTCSLCEESKPIEDFPSTKHYRSYKGQRVKGREGRCRACKAAYAREWRKRNPGYNGTGKLTSIPEEDRFLVSAISQKITDAKGRAKKRGYTCDLARDYMYQLYKDQDGRCALSGVQLKAEVNAVTCLSIDKIRPEGGYVEGNVQWVAWAVNRAKGDMETDVFVDMCRQVLEYQKVQRLSKGALQATE